MVFTHDIPTLLLYSSYRTEIETKENGLYISVEVTIPPTSRFPMGDRVHIGFYRYGSTRVAFILPLGKDAPKGSKPPLEMCQMQAVLPHALYLYLNTWVQRRGATKLLGCTSSREIIARSVKL